MNPGSVIAFRDKRSLALAFVRKVEGARLRVTNEKGKEFPYPKDRVALVLPCDLDAGAPREAVIDALAGVRSRAEGQVGEVDLELLWETAREEAAEGVELPALGSLYFGEEPSALQLLSLLWVLEGDRAYFKRKGDTLVPKDQEVVQETLRQLAQEAQRAQERADALAWCKQALEGEDPGDDPPGWPPLRDLLKDAAVHGEAGGSWTKAQALLAELGRSGPTAAFDVLHMLGVFTLHENLALHAHRIRVDFPAEVEADARALAEAPLADEPRLDLRHLPTVAIDDAETTEVDDALSLEDDPEGGHVAWIHIADVSAFVPMGSLVDEEALRRGTSVYLPEATIPMIPDVLSMDRCSLRVGEDRPALSVKVRLDPEGQVREASFHASTIQVDRSLTYEEAVEGIADDPQLAGLHAVSSRQRELRQEAGATSYERQEIRIKVDDEGQIHVKKVVGDSPGQVLVSEMMILANRVTGLALSEAGVPALYKCQARPTKEEGSFIPKSTLGLEVGEHFGLGLPAYCQMTSPIRRYADLAMHRQLGSLIGRPHPAHPRAQLETVMGSVQDRDGAAGVAQREGKRYWLLEHLDRSEAPHHQAKVGSQRRGKMVQVRLDDTLLPVMMPLPPTPKLAEGDSILVKLTDSNARLSRLRVRFHEKLLPELPEIPAASPAG